jgi:hypothetical protein
LKTLVLNAKKITAFGAEAEFGQLGQQLKQTERQLDFAASDKSWKTSPPTRELPDEETISRLTSADFQDLDMSNPVKAAQDATQKVDVIVNNILDYFGIPVAVRGTDSAGVIMSRITGDERWPEVLDIIKDVKNFTMIGLADTYETMQSSVLKVAPILKTQVGKWKEILEAYAKETIGANYRIVTLLPDLIRAEPNDARTEKDSRTDDAKS